MPLRLIYLKGEVLNGKSKGYQKGGIRKNISRVI